MSRAHTLITGAVALSAACTIGALAILVSTRDLELPDGRFVSPRWRSVAGFGALSARDAAPSPRRRVAARGAAMKWRGRA